MGVVTPIGPNRNGHLALFLRPGRGALKGDFVMKKLASMVVALALAWHSPHRHLLALQRSH
jgi:hypothetical protein